MYRCLFISEQTIKYIRKVLKPIIYVFVFLAYDELF